MDIDYRTYNAHAWDYECGKGNIWTDGCSAEDVDAVRNGKYEAIRLLPFAVPDASWYGIKKDLKVLTLASGGGQQAVLFAASGCDTTDLDISTSQLEQDRKMAEKYHLSLKTVQGDMQDLSVFAPGSFDLVFNPSSTCFAEDVELVYRECFRVLKPGGLFLTVAINPAIYMFDEKKVLHDRLKVKYTIPYSDIKSLSQKELKAMEKKNDTFEFSHTVDSLVGGLCRAGFVLEDFTTGESGNMAVDSFLHDCFFAIKARKR